MQTRNLKAKLYVDGRGEETLYQNIRRLANLTKLDLQLAKSGKYLFLCAC